MRLIRIALCSGLLALPVTCARPSDGLYAGGVQPSPSSRVNPFEQGIANDGSHAR